MSEPKMLDFLRTVGLLISAGQLSDMLIKDQERFHAERATVEQADLASSPWQHLDSTGTRVNGNNEQCHILCNPLYTTYWTLPAKDRLSLLHVLQGGADRAFQMNDLALELLPQLGVTQQWCRTLPTLLSHDQTYTESHLDDVLKGGCKGRIDPLREGLTGYELFLLSALVKRSQTTLHTLDFWLKAVTDL